MAPYIMSDNMTYKREKSRGKLHFFSICELLKLTIFEQFIIDTGHIVKFIAMDADVEDIAIVVPDNMVYSMTVSPD